MTGWALAEVKMIKTLNWMIGETKMKKPEKLDYLQNNCPNKWFPAYREEEDKLSDQQPMFCLCGRLATGLHERYCARFKNKVRDNTIGRLKHLLPKAGKSA